MLCSLCPNLCAADRARTKGRCGAPEALRIAKYSLHPYEEPVISGSRGSGTVFFCGCPLSCVFCQNYEVSRGTVGREITPRRLADIFRELEDMGAHNVNLVNPTHYYPQIMRALELYRPGVPVVVNTHGYERAETLRAFDGYADVYLPDLKFYSPALSERYTGVRDYFERASEAVAFMAQKPVVIEDGLMKSGTIVRHLILPLASGDSLKIVDWFAREIGDRAYFSLMAQYTPFGKIADFPELQRKITRREYERVAQRVYERGITRCFLQERTASGETYIPNWEN